MIRETLISHKSEVIITLPENYVDREIEITIDLAKDKKDQKYYDQFFGVLKDKDLDEELNKLRGEWEREF